jgi:hypothetical protein
MKEKLKILELEKYEEIIKENEIEEFEDMMYLSKQEFKELGMNLGERNLLYNFLQKEERKHKIK